MDADKAQILAWIDAERDALLGFFSEFLQAASPNPPGDTRAAVGVMQRWLAKQGLDCRLVAPQETMPNLVASFEGALPGRHLVLNGHVDVFPAAPAEPGGRDPFSGAIENGRIYGRGAADMKCGTSAAMITFGLLSRLRDRLKGRLTLTAVSDAETGGRWGTRYLVETMPGEVLGDCCLNGEPSGIETVRFADKGTLRITFEARTKGGHGAYPHLSPSATKIVCALAQELLVLEAIEPELPEAIRELLARPEVIAATDKSLGEGAAAIVPRVTVNIGVLEGGLKVNVLPGSCQMQVDIRMPPGMTKERIMREIEPILARYPEVTMSEHVHHSYPSSACDPEGEMVGIIQGNVEALQGFRPVPIVSLGGSDARYWRWKGVEAYLYGPSPRTMGQRDENITVEEFFHIVRTHALSAYDYLQAS